MCLEYIIYYNISCVYNLYISQQKYMKKSMIITLVFDHELFYNKLFYFNQSNSIVYYS